MKSRRAIHAAVVIVASVALVAGYLLLTNASYEQLRKNDYDIGRSSIETSVENTMRLIEDERSLHTNDDGSVDDEEAKAEVYRILMDQKVTSNQYVWGERSSGLRRQRQLCENLPASEHQEQGGNLPDHRYRGCGGQQALCV
jgi:hypothetical protein